MKIALEQARKTFLTERERDRMSAMQRVALQIMAGIDIDRLEQASEPEKQHAVHRLTRLIERERLKGTNGHWSYDLNRHIALKQALDRLEGKERFGACDAGRGARQGYGQRRRIHAATANGTHKQRCEIA